MTRQALLSFLVLSCVIAMGCRNSPTPPPQAESGTPTSQTKKRRDRAFTCAAGRRRDVLEDDLRVPADPPPGDETADEVPVFAPVNGYIMQKNITPGKTVELSTDTFVIGDLSEVWMLASVRQENLGEVRLGQPATVALPGAPGHTFSGKVTNLGQEFDPATWVMQVRIVLANPDNRLRPEMLANAEIPVGERKRIWKASKAMLNRIIDFTLEYRWLVL